MSRHAYCIFCDDIRLEVGNKTSLIGIYGGVLSVAQFPVVLPKLCVITYCASPIEQEFKSLSVRIFNGDTLLVENTVPSEYLRNAYGEIVAQGSEKEPIEEITIGLNAAISPFMIEKESILKVVVIADGVEATAGKLRMRQGAVPQVA